MTATAPPASKIAVIKIKAIFFIPTSQRFFNSACVKMILHVVRVYGINRDYSATLPPLSKIDVWNPFPRG